MAKIDAANTLMFGSESDAIYLSEYTKNLLNPVTALDSAVPTAMEDMGWISEDGLSINLNDSSDKIKGHQGHGTVRLYMSDSTTQLEVSLLEAKAKTLGWNFDATVEKVTGQGGKPDYAKVVAPSARAAHDFTGLVDGFDTANSTTQWRILFPRLTLGEREGIAMKVGELTVFKFTLEVIGGFTILTNHPAMIPA